MATSNRGRRRREGVVSDFYVACTADPFGLGVAYKAAQAIGIWAASRAVCREKWCFDTKEAFEKKRLHADTYNKIKTTNIEWKTYGKLVLDLGG